MLYYLAPLLTEFWGPFRLLGSYMVLIGLGATLAALVNWLLLPRLSHVLPRDRGRAHTPNAEAAVGKPTGAGFLMVLFTLPVLLLVLPLSLRFWELILCLVLAMVTGYLDDRSVLPWGEYVKGTLDLGVAALTALVLCGGKPVVMWVPLTSQPFELSPWLFVPLAVVILWAMINATNCSDGLDGLAGSLTLVSLFYLGAFLYVVIGHVEAASYLLVPHNPEGARWAVLTFTAAGALAGYLWHNAQPSSMMMGDAGSRFLGLLVGVAVLAAGNPFLILVIAPVVLLNGGTGIVKIAVLRGFRKMGFDVRPPALCGAENGAPPLNGQQHVVVRVLHKVRFPLHDHCRKNLEWSNPQVLLRFVLLQAFLVPILLSILVKVR